MFKKGNRANTLHGILLIALFSFAAFYIAEIPFVKSLSFSPLIVGIILGMLYANSLRNKLPETWVPGIKFCTKQVLRAGIVLYGFRLTLTQVAAVGLPGSGYRYHHRSRYYFPGHLAGQTDENGQRYFSYDSYR